MRTHFVFLAVGLTAFAGGAAAQDQPAARWRVIPNVGVIKYEPATALSATDWHLSFGVETHYELTSSIRIGLFVEASPTSTDASYFQPAALPFGSTIAVDTVSQDVLVFHYGATAAYELALGQSLRPFVRGGVGGYWLLPDAQANNSPGSVSGFMLAIGGGLGYRVSSNVAVSAELMDFIWSGFDRDDLDPVTNHATGFDGANYGSAKPDPAHNLRVAFGLTFYPGGGGQR